MQVWTIVISSPTGDIRATLNLSDADGVVSGEMTGKNGSGPMLDLVSKDDVLNWSTKIDRPMPMTLKFKGQIDGDTLSGSVKFGMFASGSFTGERVRDAA